MANKIETLPDGKLHVELETGEKFDGDPLEVTAKLAEAQVNTKRWGQEWKVKAETPPTPVVTPPTPEAQNQAQLRAYLLDEHAHALGYNSGSEYKAELAAIKETTKKQNVRDSIQTFHLTCPEFPNNDEASGKLLQRLKEDFGIEDIDAYAGLYPEKATKYLVSTNRNCIADGVYKPLNPEEQRRAVGDQAAIEQQRRPTAPPIVRSSSPDSENRGLDLWKEPMAEQRARLIREQLEGR